MNCDTAKSHVFPYVDGELTPDARRDVDAHLGACAACRRLVAVEREFREACLARLRPDPAPAAVRDRVGRLLADLVPQAPARAARRTPRHLRHAVAALAVLVVGIAVGIGVASLLAGRDRLAELTEASVQQHQKLARGVLPPDIAGTTPKSAETWFRKRLSFNVTLPDIKTADLSLLGARISHLAEIEVAALEYQLDGHNVSLFIIPGSAYQRLGLSDSSFKVLTHRGYDVIIWRHHGTGYALVSEIGGRSCLVCHVAEEKVERALPPSPRL